MYLLLSGDEGRTDVRRSRSSEEAENEFQREISSEADTRPSFVGEEDRINLSGEEDRTIFSGEEDRKPVVEDSEDIESFLLGLVGEGGVLDVDACVLYIDVGRSLRGPISSIEDEVEAPTRGVLSIEDLVSFMIESKSTDRRDLDGEVFKAVVSLLDSSCLSKNCRTEETEGDCGPLGRCMR